MVFGDSQVVSSSFLAFASSASIQIFNRCHSVLDKLDLAKHWKSTGLAFHSMNDD